MKVDHFALSVSSIENSVEWYKRTLGASVEETGKKEEALIQVGEFKISLVKKDLLNPRHIVFDVNSANTASLLEMLNVGTADKEMKDISSSYVYITDPDGNTIQLGAHGSLDID